MRHWNYQNYAINQHRLLKNYRHRLFCFYYVASAANKIKIGK
jgi:hypothetical protein